MSIINNIIKMETKLKYIGSDPLLKLFSEPYYLTGMPRDTNGKMMFVFDTHTNTGWGDESLCFTGMNSVVMNETEVNKNFELWRDKNGRKI